MDMPDIEIEVQVFKGKSKETKLAPEIFGKIYGANEIDKLLMDIARFLNAQQSDLTIVIERTIKPVLETKAHVTQTTSARIQRADKTQLVQSNSIVGSKPLLGLPASSVKNTKNVKKLPQEEERTNKSSINSSDAQGRKLKFMSIAGCHGVEASAHLLTIDGHVLLLDAGFSERNALTTDALKKQKPEAIFITHAHLDHIGSLPIVHRMLPSSPIYMTSATKTLAYTILSDSLNVATSKGNNPFTKEEIDRTLESVVTVDFNQEFDFKNLKVEFRCAGHILGAAYIIIEGESRVLYTGDISNSTFLTTPCAFVPKSNESVDLLISESTYGSTINTASRETQIANFCAEVSNVIERGGRVLIPSFALGRAQEVLTILLNEMNRGNLRKVQVVLDGMARTITERYDDYSDFMPSDIYRQCRRSKLLRPVSDSQNREKIAGDDTPCIIIASSGMLAGGPSVAYAKKILEEEKSAIFIVGYIDEEAPGKQIANSKLGEPVELISEDGTKESVIRRCDVREYRLSAHSNQKELVRFCMSYEPATVFLVHGETEAKVCLAKALLRSKISPVFIPENQEEIDVDNVLKIWTRIKMAEAEKQQVEEDLSVIYGKTIDKLHDKCKELPFEEFVQVIEEAGFLRWCGSPMETRKAMYNLFGWSFKYATTSEGLDFGFSAKVLQNGATLMKTLYGNGFRRRFLRDLDGNILAMFKNFILFGGPIVTRKFFKTSIESKKQLQFSLDNFQSHFADLDLHTPELLEVQKICQDYAEKRSTAKERYSTIFADSQIQLDRVEKIAESSKVEAQKERVEAPKITSRIAEKIGKMKEKPVAPEPVCTEGLIGFGSKFGNINPKKPEAPKQIMEVRETFAGLEPSCIFCGSTKLELLKVTNPDPKTCRSEYKCTECKFVFAVRAPNL